MPSLFFVFNIFVSKLESSEVITCLQLAIKINPEHKLARDILNYLTQNFLSVIKLQQLEQTISKFTNDI